MKRIISLFLVILSVFSIFAESDRIIHLEAGISSGYCFYGDSSINSANSGFNNGSFNRFFFGPTAGISLKIAQSIRFIAGADTFIDFIWNGNSYYRRFDYDIYGGIRYYPGLKGLNFSASYCGGQRLDFCNVPEIAPSFSSSTWGNGFRICAEYDWHYESSNEVMPAAGISYRFMPRGENFYDNILTAYLVFSY